MVRGMVCLVVSLLVGLARCGPASPDPIGRAAIFPSSKLTVTATPNHQNRLFNSDVNVLLQSTLKSALERSTTHAQSHASASPEAAQPAPADTDPTAAARQQRFAEARVNSDVSVRRQVLELWAEQPSQDLDPLTCGLVDEDESVRTRALELYEQQLTREATEAPRNTADAQPTHHAE